MWTGEDVPREAVDRIIEAGMRAPSWDHYRAWQFIVLRERADRERAFAYAKGVADRYVSRHRAYARPNLAQRMYAYAMPLQYSMLVECPYVVVPLFRCQRLNAEWVSKLNPLSTAWCVVENMLLAATNEGLDCSLRIPLNREHDVVLGELGVPKGWMTPCFIGVGHPRADEPLPEQYGTEIEGHVHEGCW